MELLNEASVETSNRYPRALVTLCHVAMNVLRVGRPGSISASGAGSVAVGKLKAVSESTTVRCVPTPAANADRVTVESPCASRFWLDARQANAPPTARRMALRVKRTICCIESSERREFRSQFLLHNLKKFDCRTWFGSVTFAPVAGRIDSDR